MAYANMKGNKGYRQIPETKFKIYPTDIDPNRLFWIFFPEIAVDDGLKLAYVFRCLLAYAVHCGMPFYIQDTKLTF